MFNRSEAMSGAAVLAGATLVGLGLAVAVAGCSATRFAADQTADVLAIAAPALDQESDVELARAAAPGQLKTVEGFYLASPENKVLITILAKGYCEYTFGFLENDIEVLTMSGRVDDAVPLVKRATGLYQRCMGYGLKLLGGSWAKAFAGDIPSLLARIEKVDDADMVPGLFYTALGLASTVNLNRDNIDFILYMPIAEALFEKVVKLDPGYYDGGSFMALGLAYVALGEALGGKERVAQGKAHFEEAIRRTGGKYLIPKVLFAVGYGRATNNVKFFHDTLVEVLETPPSIWPEKRLANELAHIRARRYLALEKEWF